MDIDGYLPLSAREFHILLSVSGEPLNGYQVSQSVEETSNGTVRLSPATQYVNLHRLVEKGLLQEVTDREKHRSDGRRHDSGRCLRSEFVCSGLRHIDSRRMPSSRWRTWAGRTEP